MITAKIARYYKNCSPILCLIGLFIWPLISRLTAHALMRAHAVGFDRRGQQ